MPEMDSAVARLLRRVALGSQLIGRAGLGAAARPRRAASSGAAVPPASAAAATVACCWSCGACSNQWKLFCGSCAYLQPLDRVANYFQLLSIPQSFDVDVAALERSFKSLQKSVHPDLFGSRSASEQQVSAQLSSNLNIGYRVLRNPVSRAQYLLQLAGLDAIGEGAGSVRVPPTLLGEVMEGRELLEEAAARPAEYAPRVRGLAGEADARIRALLQDASAHFAGGDLAAAAAATVALQYWTKLRAEAAEWLSAHVPGGGGGGGGDWGEDTTTPEGCGACDVAQQCPQRT